MEADTCSGRDNIRNIIDIATIFEEKTLLKLSNVLHY